jgi:hypothetical protein
MTAITAAQTFQATVHPGIENFSLIENRIKNVFLKAIKALLFLPKTIYGWMHRIVGIPIYPAPIVNSEHRAIEAHKALFADKSISFKTADGITLTGAHFSPEGKKADKTMIYFLGNADNFLMRTPNSIQKKADDLGLNLFIFNYRGNNPSEGTRSREGLILDGDAALQYVRSLGASDKHIILHGTSLGGAIAAQVASIHPQVNFCSERSFSKLSDEIIHLFGGGILGKILSKAACLFGWEFDSLKAWEKIGGHKWVIQAPYDGIIKPEAQFAKHVSYQDKSIPILNLGQRFGWPTHVALNPRNPEDVKKVLQIMGMMEHNYDIFERADVIDFYKSQLSKI